MKKNSIFKYYASLALGLALSSSLCASYDVTTVAGNGTADFSGDDGLATSAKINNPLGTCIDKAGNVYILDSSNNRIRKIALDGTISTVAGTGIAGFSGDGGAATYATLSNPTEICIDSTGIVYFADFNNSCIRKIALDGTISTVAGIGGVAGASSSGVSATSTDLDNPIGLCVDDADNLYIADTYCGIIQKFTVGGIITTIAGIVGTGGSSWGYSGDGSPATSAQLNKPTSICIDSSGNIYIADANNNRIRMFKEGGNITTVAGTGIAGYSGDGGAATGAAINAPRGVCIDSLGALYIADYLNQRIRKFTVGGNISTIAGTGIAGYSGDGGPAISARIFRPYGVDADNFGNIYIADSANNRIRKLPPPSIALEVDGTDSATVSASLSATTVHKTGGGTAVLSGNNSSVSILALKAGLVKVRATNNMGASLAFAGGNMEVTSGTVAVPTAAMNQAGRITTDASAAVSSIAAPSGTSLLTIAGPGVVTAGDMSASYTPLSIPGVMYVGASSASKMPTGVATVLSGGLVKIMGATASSVPGATEIQSGGVLEVLASVAVPVHTSAADIFGTLKFNSGSILKLGAGASWARNMRIGTAL